MEVKTKQQQLHGQARDQADYRQRIEAELGEQMEKTSRAQRSFAAKLNNVKAVRGPQFENSKENFEILAEVEQLKNKSLLGALQMIVQEFPDFAQVLEGPLAENGIRIPSRPGS